MRLVRATLFAVLLLASTFGSAASEIYMGIEPYSSLGDVKQLFPSATIERLKPAWAQKEDVLCQITGKGLSGTIIVKFHDPRPMFTELASEQSAAQPNTEVANIWEELANEPDDGALSVQWVRWIPYAQISLKRVIAKYGKPSYAGFRDDDLMPLRSWPNRAMSAYLSDDEKFVIFIDFNFTEKERNAAHRKRYGDSAPPPPPPAPPSTSNWERSGDTSTPKSSKQRSHQR